LNDGSESRRSGENPARDDNAEWTFEPQGEILKGKYPRRVAPVIELEHKPKKVVLEKSEAGFFPGASSGNFC